MVQKGHILRITHLLKVLSILLVISVLYIEGRTIRRSIDAELREELAKTTETQNSSTSFRPSFQTVFYRYASLGHTQSLVDWYIIRSAGDDDLRWTDPNVRSNTFYQYDLMTNLDPYYLYLYVAGANYLTVAKNDNLGALSIVQKGRAFYENELGYLPEEFKVREWPTAWQLHLIEGYIQLFELQNIQGAMEVYEWLDEFPDLPLSLLRVSKKIKTAHGRIQMGLNSVQSMLESARADLNKERLLVFKQKLIISQFLLFWNQQWTSFQIAKKIEKGQSLSERWPEFAQSTRIPNRDPIGGEVYLNAEGKVWTRSDWKPMVGEEREF